MTDEDIEEIKELLDHSDELDIWAFVAINGDAGDATIRSKKREPLRSASLVGMLLLSLSDTTEMSMNTIAINAIRWAKHNQEVAAWIADTERK